MADALDPGCKVSADRAHVREQAISLDCVEYGHRCGAGDRIAPERAAVITLLQHRAIPGDADARADGQAAAKALGQREDVRDDALSLVREPRAGPADATLDLVEHQQGPGLITGFPRSLQVAGRGRHHTALAKRGL